MQVALTPHSEQLVRQQLARGLGRSPEEVIERALEASQPPAVLTETEKERRRQAVAAVHAFREQHRLTLGSGLRIRDLIREDCKG